MTRGNLPLMPLFLSFKPPLMMLFILRLLGLP